ncbi:MAG: hypothetical protein JRI91_16740 [Deltaproteobacteria bacterium]|nr:hypothetical protein [Deltaproteobacteria bacterium]
MRTKQISVFLLLSIISFCFSQDVCPGSYNPPGGLSMNRVPMFIAFGWDDNQYADGMNWILDYLKDKKNPAGIGNAATFDRTPVLNTFFMKGLVDADDPPEEVYVTWKRAYDEGHEIGNHTWRHVAIDPVNEIRRCDSTLEFIGIPTSEVVGFRTPQLALVLSVFDAVYARKFLYDCTVEHHNTTPEGQFVWPYTLENGWHSSSFGALTKSYPGMWEMPVHQFPGGETGFDYNAWTSGASGSSFCNTLKTSLDFHMSSNRCPFLIGTHSDYYATNNTYFEGLTSSTCSSRRKAITDFIDYALTKPDVRIVRFDDIIKWMRHPVALDDNTYVQITPVENSVNSLSINVLPDNRIKLSIPVDGTYKMSIYSLNGRKINALTQKHFSAGPYTIKYNTKSVAAGVYIFQIKSMSGQKAVCSFLAGN